MTEAKSLSHMSYGLQTPEDLMEKLRHDAKKITAEPHRHDLFNFFVTAAVMHEWCRKYYSDHPVSQQLAKAAAQPPAYEALPREAAGWIEDRSCLPNCGQDARQHIVHALRICIDIANASKHFYWRGNVSAIEPQPKIKNWHQYFFTPAGPGVYVEYSGQYYTVEQIRDTLLQFFAGLLRHVRADTKT